MMEAQSSSNQEVKTLSKSKAELIARDPDFGSFEGLNKYWAVGNPQLSFGMSFFSMVIPEGEKFFIRSVNAYKDQISDPKLKEDVKTFVKQEAIHAKQHLDFNDALREHGYDVDLATKRTKEFFEFIEKHFSKKTCLSITVFIEHLTALGGEVEMRFPELNEGTHPQAAKFWRWHAAEELEHKSVAFDVHKAIGGGYFSRMFGIMVMVCLEPFFMWSLVRQQVKKTREVKTEEIPVAFKEVGKNHPQSVKNLFHFGRKYFLSYFKPSFHPWNIDSRNYLNDWREEYKDSALSH